MENVPQETLKKVAIKYFKLYENQDNFHTFTIVSDHPVLGAAFPIIMEIEKINEGGYKISFTDTNEDDVTYKDVKEINEVLNYIDKPIISIKLNIIGFTDYGKLKYSVFLYKNGLLFVYPGNDCSDKNLISRVNLEAEVSFKRYEIEILEDHVNLINDIRDFKDKPKETERKIAELKKTDLPETNRLNEAIIQLAIARNNSFGETTEECFRFLDFYKNTISEIINGDLITQNLITFIREPMFIENCDGVINLVRDLERVIDNLDKMKEHLNQFISNFLDEENINVDNVYEKLKDMREKSFKKYTKAIKKHNELKKERKKQSKKLKKVTGVVHATVPFSFGKGNGLRSVESDIGYLSKKI